MFRSWSVGLWFLVCLAITSANVYASSSTSSSFTTAANASLFWGTYRPNLYFGMKTRSPKDSVMTGLMWHGLQDFSGFKNVRHGCEQGEIGKYGWDQHDGRLFGSQTLEDPSNGVRIKTEFVKVPGSANGGDHAVRISGEKLGDAEGRLMIYYYIGLDGEGSLKVDGADGYGIKGSLGKAVISGETPVLGDFKLTFVDGSGSKENEVPIGGVERGDLPTVGNLLYSGLKLPPGELWKIKDYTTQKLLINAKEHIAILEEAGVPPSPAQSFSFRCNVEEDSNVIIVQRALRTPFSLDIVFNSKTGGKEASDLSGSSLTNKLEEMSISFENRFESTFGLRKKGYSSDMIKFAQATMSNLVGGIGFFHGHNIVDRALEERARKEIVDTPKEAVEEDVDDYFELDLPESTKPNPQVEGPWSLFTAVPSRPFFPRGFMWDEGFHQLLVGRWDNDLSLDILSHWAHLIDERGWVAREQILGDEAHSKVPAEFQIQYSHFANPPTLLMGITSFLDRLKTALPEDDKVAEQYNFGSESPEEAVRKIANHHLKDRTGAARAFLRQVYPKFAQQREFFKDTQWGDVDEWHRDATTPEAYRWRGRTDRHTLTSGLDDYPRSFPPHDGELHVDLTSWMGFMVKALHKVAVELGDEDAAAKYKRDLRNVIENLDLQSKIMLLMLQGEREFVNHPGYLSLFPYILGLVTPISPKVSGFLDLIRDESHLWTPYGLRSLSKSDPFFATDENYWRGPIWININYLALGALKGYANSDQSPKDIKARAAKIYKELRDNVVQNIFKVYTETGFVWEQYSPETGEGKRSRPFTGWTSLVVLIMSEQYPSLIE
ncbi:Processing alpha glucosidase I [Phlyctochytrium planicorne]|nr:Processing alpha glucosidase I [Phlyctochytrium planicorne]